MKEQVTHVKKTQNKTSQNVSHNCNPNYYVLVSTFIFRAFGLLGQQFDFLLLPLTQHFPLKASNGAQELITSHL